LHCLAHERRLASPTIVTSESHMRRFFKWLAPKRELIAQVTPSDIEEFLCSKQTTCSLRSVAGEARLLKDFFSFAEEHGLCSGVVKRSIFAPSISRPSYRGKRISWTDARLLSDGICGQRPCDLRAKAIILLCSIYALRSSEVAGLQLDNFKWEAGTFSLIRAKRGKAQEYPIQFEVGEAIIAYLRAGRPRSHCRNLFLSIALPYRPISPAIVFNVVSTRLSKLGVEASPKGAHALRHACATQLLNTGSSLKEIADFLGHRNLRSVSNYVRHDLAALRGVADFRMLGDK
jgi:integrase/recombinase XerD